MKHETSKHHQVQANQGGRKPLVIAHQPPEAGCPAKERSTIQRRGNKTKLH